MSIKPGVSMRPIPVVFAVVVALALPASASAVTVSKAQLSNGQLRIEGAGAPAGVFVSVDGGSGISAGGRADVKGAFKIQADNFRSNTCRVIVSDGRGPVALPTLSGCTPAPATPPVALPPTGSCVIAPSAPAAFSLGDLSTSFFTTTGCDTSTAPVQWSLVEGQTPLGMGSPVFQGQTGGALSGRPTLEGTYTFTLGVVDSVGATDTETFTITIAAPRPVAVTTDPALRPATRGAAYDVLLAADGGLPGYTWSLAAGTLPPGVRVTGGHVAGTPTATGTYTFTVAATDSRGDTGTRTLTLTIQ
jgi:Putative Ig domain